MGLDCVERSLRMKFNSAKDDVQNLGFRISAVLCIDYCVPSLLTLLLLPSSQPPLFFEVFFFARHNYRSCHAMQLRKYHT